MELQVPIKLIFALLIQIFAVCFAVREDPYLLKEQKRDFRYLSVCVLVLLALDLLTLKTEKSDGFSMIHALAMIIRYGIRPAILILFLKISDCRKDRHTLWQLAAANAVFCAVAVSVQTGIPFFLEERVPRAVLECACQMLSAVLTVLLAYESCSCKTTKGMYRLIPLMNVILLIASAAADQITDWGGPVRFLTVSTAGCSLMYYFWLHLQLAHENEQAHEAEKRIQLMMSQIQPHFLYNTLSTIQALCRLDPEKAFETTEKFGTYLRMNIDSLKQTDLIPFQKELEHTKIYADIEMMRFPYIHIRYDIKEDDFFLPALSIQPIVENAIRHGVRGHYNGMVTVSTNTDGHDYIIRIEDNGKGFDPETAISTDDLHIGIRNVRERVEMMCDGSLTIQSSIAKGTVVTIRIPQ